MSDAVRERSRVMMALRGLGTRGKRVAQRVADVQARALLGVFYFILLAPFGLGVKLLADPLRLQFRSGSRWLPRDSTDGDPMTRATRQY